MNESSKKVIRNKKILYVCKLFIEEEDLSVNDISKITGIPRSTVLRYLNSELVKELITPSAHSYIRNKIKNAKLEGSRKGGKISSQKNTYIKDSNGKFIGSVKN